MGNQSIWIISVLLLVSIIGEAMRLDTMEENTGQLREHNVLIVGGRDGASASKEHKDTVGENNFVGGGSEKDHGGVGDRKHKVGKKQKHHHEGEVNVDGEEMALLENGNLKTGTQLNYWREGFFNGVFRYLRRKKHHDDDD